MFRLPRLLCVLLRRENYHVPVLVVRSFYSFIHSFIVYFKGQP